MASDHTRRPPGRGREAGRQRGRRCGAAGALPMYRRGRSGAPVRGCTPPPETRARKNVRNRSVSGSGHLDFSPRPPPYRLYLCSAPHQRASRGSRSAPGGQERARQGAGQCVDALPGDGTRRSPSIEAKPRHRGWLDLLQVVTSEHRGHRGQMPESALIPCPALCFLSPVEPGTNPQAPGTPGTPHSSKVHSSPGNRGRPCVWYLVHARAVMSSAKQAPATTAHRRSALQMAYRLEASFNLGRICDTENQLPPLRWASHLLRLNTLVQDLHMRHVWLLFD